jgi:hypothetical protein
MHGNPIIRVLALTAALAVMALVVSSITHGSRSSADPTLPVPDSGSTTAESMVPAQLSIQLSAPARSLSIRTGDAETVLVAPHQPAGTEEEFRFGIPIEERATTLLLDVTWENPAPNRFLRLVLEIEDLPTRELTIHAPDDLENHAVTVTWPPNPELASP